MCGGFTEGRQASADEVAIAHHHQADVETSTGKKFTKFEVVSVKTQVVAGTNFDFVVQTSEGQVKFRVYRPLPGQGQTSLTSATLA